MNAKRNRRGVCIIETVVGAAVLVPICLFGLDVLTLVLSESVNDHLAKDAARCAANQMTLFQAQAAAINKVRELHLSAIITDAQVDKFDYQNNNKVFVQTRLSIKMPAPFPFFSSTKLYSRSTEAVVAAPADL